jgi:TrmH family RNA methyltransferase
MRIILVRPRGGANVGAVARAMKNMGLDDLVLVRPAVVRAFWSKAMAVHAEDVLSRARRCDSLAEAVADCGLVAGTTSRQGSYRRAAVAPRDAASHLIAAATANRVALVFGPEDHGLSNEDLKLCQQLIMIPTAPEYPSLNLAQAVMVCGYELFLAAQTTAVPTQELAQAARVEFMFERMQAAFLSIGFLHSDNPDHIMFALRRVLGRAQLEEQDVNIGLGLARQIEWFGRGGWRTMAEKRSPHPGGEAAEGMFAGGEGKETSPTAALERAQDVR